MENENNDEEKSKAAAVAREREARRRRILENSNNRLGKITGRVHDEEEIVKNDVQLDSNGIYPDPDFERDVYEGPIIRNGMGGQDPDIMEVLRLMQNEQMNINPAASSGAKFQQQQQVVVETPLSKLIKSPLPIVAIALIVYVFFILELDTIIGGAVFSLFIAWEVLVFTLTAFVLNNSSANSYSHLINLVPLFAPSLNPKALQIILKFLMFANKVMRDLAVFIFTFVITHFSYSYLIVGESFQVILDKDFSSLFGR